jgi:hypothetical protein
MTSCRYCDFSVNQPEAELAADQLDKINSACSIAGGIQKGTYVMVPLLFLASLILLLADEPYSGTGLAGAYEKFYALRRSQAVPYFPLLFLIGPFPMIAWFMKFKDIQTDEPDFQQAKKEMKISLILWLSMLAIRIVLQIIVPPIKL